MPARWNGSVVVEWFNVSGGLDAAPDWDFTHRHLMRAGFAWVGVSAQRVGIEGGGFAAMSLPLKTVNAERYGSLSHPGDAFAFDIFSQAGRAVRDGRLLGGLAPRRVLAIGESQSAAVPRDLRERGRSRGARLRRLPAPRPRRERRFPRRRHRAQPRAPSAEAAAAVSSGRGDCVADGRLGAHPRRRAGPGADAAVRDRRGRARQRRRAPGRLGSLPPLGDRRRRPRGYVPARGERHRRREPLARGARRSCSPPSTSFSA